MTISDDKFIEQFENQTLPPELFDHYGHLRLAWLYLNMHPLEQAINKVTIGLSVYATSLGATDKFQHTLTEAIVRIMAIRMKRCNFDTLESYLKSNRDLVDDILTVVGTHYSHDQLNSARARTEFVCPDLAPLTPPDRA